MIQKRIIEENHHHWHLDKITSELFLWLILLTTVTAFVGMIVNGVQEEQNMYNSCLDACTEKISYWNQNPEIVNAGDRIECIRVCNSFHYSLTHN